MFNHTTYLVSCIYLSGKNITLFYFGFIAYFTVMEVILFHDEQNISRFTFIISIMNFYITLRGS